MALTPAQYPALKADILADPAINTQPMNDDGHQFIADYYNVLFTPDYWVWRTNVSRVDVYNLQDFEGNFWNWTTFKNQGATEQTAWIQMFMGDAANFAADNLRAGVAAIFTGSGAATAQRDHILSVGRRKATKGEHIYAVGSGTTASPSKMGFEGKLTRQDVSAARNS